MKTLLITLVLAITATAQTVTADRIDYPNLPATGAQKVVTIGGYGATYFSYDFGMPRHDDVLCFGYNCGGPEYNSNNVQWSQAFESYYTTSEGRTQSEFYFTACQPNGGTCSRPFGIDFYHDDGSTQVGVGTRSFVIGGTDNNPWVRFNSAPSDNWMHISRDGRLDFYGNTNPYFITYAGTGLMGKSGNTFKLFTGGIQGETIQMLEGSSAANAPLTFRFGNGGLRLVGQQWQMSTPSGYADIQARFEPCAPIANSEGEKSDDTRAINEILACLRQQGLVAQDSGAIIRP